MGILLENQKNHWLPNNSIYWKFIDDALAVTAGRQRFQWIEREAGFLKEAHIYALDLREAPIQKIVDILEATSIILFLKEAQTQNDKSELIYLDHLITLRNNLRQSLLQRMEEI